MAVLFCSVCIFADTRKARQGEQDGINYHFIEKTVFERMVQEKKFVEHANVSNEWYGTSIGSIGAVRNANMMFRIT